MALDVVNWVIFIICNEAIGAAIIMQDVIGTNEDGGISASQELK
jgi:hypothetical protein